MRRASSTPRLTVIVPVRNEAPILRGFLRTLERALRGSGIRPFEVVLVDGASGDGSLGIMRRWARRRPDWRLARTRPSRPSIGRAVRDGAELARSPWLLVLPVDCRLSAASLRRLTGLLAGAPGWGGFLKAYAPPALSLLPSLIALNLVRTRMLGHLVWTNAMFVHRRLLSRAGGIPARGFLDDIALSDRLRRIEQPRVIRGPVTVSSRRYRRDGTVRRLLVNVAILAAHRVLAIPPARLRRWYAGPR